MDKKVAKLDDGTEMVFEAGTLTGVKLAAQKPTLEEQIRQIVREELAAHKERLIDAVKASLHKDVTVFLAATDGIVRGTSE